MINNLLRSLKRLRRANSPWGLQDDGGSDMGKDRTVKPISPRINSYRCNADRSADSTDGRYGLNMSTT